MVVLGLCILSMFGCAKKEVPSVEWVGINECWVSPLWGTNAPRFVRQSDGTVWLLGFEGHYPASETVIYRRDVQTGWSEAGRISDCYQPSVILLDENENLHLLTNSQTDPTRHIRGVWTGDSLALETVAIGNWSDGGRGWYLGAGLRGNDLYMAYISLDYDFWLTWKTLDSKSWVEPVKLFDGFADPGGNYSMLYPRFTFSADSGYIMASHTSDGSTYNFKDGVYLYSFELNNPAAVSEETIWLGRKGYDAYGYDMIYGQNHQLVAAYASGRHIYGEIDSSLGPNGIFTATKQTGGPWTRRLIKSERGFLSLSQDEAGSLYAFATNAAYAEGNFTPYRSQDHGQSWEFVPELTPIEGLAYNAKWAGLQGLQLGAGTGGKGKGFPLFLTRLLPDTTEQGLQRYELGYIEWELAK